MYQMDAASLNGAPLPDQIPIPRSWKYNQEWADRYNAKYGCDYLDKICRHSSAGFHIMDYITREGEAYLTAIKELNFCIKRISSGSLDPRSIGGYERANLNFINIRGGRSWSQAMAHREELNEIYNADLAPIEIQSILDEVVVLIGAGCSLCNQLLAHILEVQELRQFQEIEASAAQDVEKQAAHWDKIDKKHSALTRGFVYVLSNAFLPGIYKIGFTASNPDTRAKQISKQHGLPSPFKVVRYWRTKDPYIIEQRIHDDLKDYVHWGAEFFDAEYDLIEEIIERHLVPIEP
jgi:hypothetical protein